MPPMLQSAALDAASGWEAGCLPSEVVAQKRLIAWLHALQMGTLQSLMGKGEQDAELVKMAREEQQELAKQVQDPFQCIAAVIDVL